MRRLRIQADLYGRADTIHHLRNSLTDANTALTLLEQRIGGGSGTLLIEELLDIAQQSLRDMRVMIVQLQARRFKRL